MNSEKLTLTVQEAAQQLGLSRNSCYNAILQNSIPHIKIGKRILIPIKSFNSMLESAGKPKES